MDRSPLLEFFKRSIFLGSSQKTTTPKRHRTAAPKERDRFVLEGVLEYGRETMFSIKGNDITITDDTWLFGELQVGMTARARGVLIDEERYLCVSVAINPAPERNMVSH